MISIAPESSVSVVALMDRIAAKPLARLMEVTPGVLWGGAVSMQNDLMPLVGRMQPHVVIISLHPPGLDSLGSITAAITERSEATRVIAMMKFSTPLEVAGCLDAGASGCMDASAPAHEVVGVVRRVAAGVIDLCAATRLMMPDSAVEGRVG